MQALVPAAGQGTRLYPHTHTKPKAMVRLAGRPILGHILESLTATDVDDVVLVVGGPMQTQIIEYVTGQYGDRFGFEFVEQENAEGLGHSVYQARNTIGDEPVLITLGDMLFENGHARFLEAHRDGDVPDASIGVKVVDEPSHYGVVELDDGRVRRLVEKPADPPSDLAISGVYVVEDSPSLFAALEHIVENNLRGAGNEYQLTDALQRMVDDGGGLATFEVEDWYDCGRPETLLKANRVLLQAQDADPSDRLEDSVVVPPVDVGDDVTVSNSVVGPHVSVDDGATIEGSIVANAIVGRNASLERINLEESILGDNAQAVGQPTHLNLGDNSTIDL